MKQLTQRLQNVKKLQKKAFHLFERCTQLGQRLHQDV